MDTGLALKGLQHTPSMRVVHSQECEIRALKDDPDGERMTLSIKVRSKTGLESTFELGSILASVTPQQLDNIISGAVLASRILDEEHERDSRQMVKEEYLEEIVNAEKFNNDERHSSAAGSTDTHRIHNSLEPNEGVAMVPRFRHSLVIRESQESLFNMSSEFALDQITCLKQWHPNACGYHALFNACMSLVAKDADDCARLCSDEIRFWAFVFRALSRLIRHRDRTGLWKTSRLEKAILDEVHIQYLIATDPFLANYVTVIESPESLLEALHLHSVAGIRHTFILACSSHWISMALLGRRKLIVSDSHNKPLLSLDSSETSLRVAQNAVEAYRSGFRERLRSVWRYEHYPDEVLDQMYDNGVPEYWKGAVKDKMWWHHRPVYIRVEIVFRELELARAYIQAAKQAFNPDSIRDNVPPSKKHPLPRRVTKASSQVYPGVMTNLTHQVPGLAGFIRKDEELQSGDVGFDPSAPATISNRKRPPPEEIRGDAFDRQRVIPGFDQSAIERQVCLVAGTGGIGMNIAISLARLGVNEIWLIDYDVYDASNLTRQCLGTCSDVGRKKTEVAMRNIQAHNLRTKVRAIDADIVLEWNKVVDVARKCTVIFNCCDAGLMVDFALNALAKEFAIPLCCGQSFGWKFMSEFYTGAAGENCAFCHEGTLSTFSLRNHKAVYERLRAFANDDNAVVDSDLIDAFLHQDDSFRTARGAVADLIRSNHVLNNTLPINDSESLKTFLGSFHECVMQSMLPRSISKVPSLGFAPRPKPPSTRLVGSWVCPCLACGVVCVSHWAQYLTGPDPSKRNPPSVILFNMDEGMTAEEQMSYECGMALSREDRSFARSRAKADCRVCKEALLLSRQHGIMLGTENAFLRPADSDGGQAVLCPSWKLDDVQNDQARADLALEFLNQVRSLAGTRSLEPIIPALDAIVDEASSEAPSESLLWPFVELGGVPLVKTTLEDARQWGGYVQGVASGCRSAVVHCPRNGKMFRLKGCGNLDQAFPMEIKGDDGVTKSLRGCMFERTAVREMFMTKYISESGVLCGNATLGYYLYPNSMPPTINERWRWEAQNTQKLCVVFETKGEKRLGDNLLTGLELLLSAKFNREDFPKVNDHFQKASRFGDKVLIDTATAVESCMEILAFDENLLSSSRSALVDKLNVQDEIDRELVRRTDVDVFPRDILALAFNLGYECGKVMKLLEAAGVCWGTFPDRMGIHCNAHANNFVVIYDHSGLSEGSGNILAAVDFDMAFTRETFVEGLWQEKAGLLPTDFEGLLLFERTMGLRTSLAGSDFTSTGVTGGQRYANDNNEQMMLRSLIRDKVVNGYDAGLLNTPAPDVIRGAGNIVLLALMLQEISPK